MKPESLKMDHRVKSKYKTIKCLGKKVGENLQDLGLDKDLLDSTPKAWSIREKIDKPDLIKITTICSVKDPFKRMKRQAKDSEKMFANHISDKGPGSFYKEKNLLPLNSEKSSNPFKNGQKSWTDISPNRMYRWTSCVHGKMFCIIAIREMQIRILMGYCYTPIRVVKRKNGHNTKY